MNAKTDLSLLSRGARAGDADPVAMPAPPVKWKTRLLLPGAILAAVGGMLLYTARDALWPALDVKVVPVVMRTVAGGTDSSPSGESSASTGGAVVVQAPGWVEANPYSISVAALSEGVVKEVLALEGQPVKAGDVVVRMVDEDARIAVALVEAELAEAAAELQVAEAALRAAQTDWDNPVERQRAIDVNRAMVAETEAEHTQFQHQVAVEAAKAEEIAEELRRRRQSFQANAASEFEVIQLELRLKAQTALIESVKAHAGVTHGKVARAQAELKAAEETIRLRVVEKKALEEAKADVLKARGSVAKARAARDEAKLRLDRMEVRSPVDGVVQERLVEPGMRLMLASDAPNAATAVRLYDPKKLQVRVDVPLASAARVGVGQKALIVVDVLPDRTFTGVVVRLVHQADLQKNTQQVKVAIDDPAAELKPEMLARVRFLAGGAKAASNGAAKTSSASGLTRLFVPEKLLYKQGAEHVQTWIVDQNGTVASVRIVTLGDTRLNGWVELATGLKPGDRVISADPSSLAEGKRVRIVGEDTSFDQIARNPHPDPVAGSRLIRSLLPEHLERERSGQLSVSHASKGGH